MNNEEEIEIIDDLEESSVSVENNVEQPSTIENTDNVVDSNFNNDRNDEVLNNDISNNPINEEITEEKNENVETLNNDNVENVVDNNTIIDSVDNTKEEENNSNSITEEITANKTESIDPVSNNVLNDSAFKIVDNNPISVVAQPDGENNKQTVATESVIVPQENVTPQDIVKEVVTPGYENSTESENNINQGVENIVNDEIVSTPKQSQDVNITSAVDNNVTNDAIDIKETSTIQNQLGTTVIGQINGDNASTVSNVIPNSIDISAKEVAAATEKNKQVKVKTPRQKMTSIIIIVLLLVILSGGGYFGYNYFINNSVSFEAKNVSFDLGEAIPQELSYYISSTKPIVSSEYNLDLSNVKNENGTYQYTITRKNETKTGTITIGDTKGPVITFKENLMFSKNSVITKDDLVSKCEDVSNCIYELETPIDTSVSGSQDVNVVAEDDYGNQTVQNTNISIIAKSLVCKSSEVLSQDGTYNERLEDVFYFDDSNKLISSVGKKVVTFVDYGSYFALLNDESLKDKYNFDRKTFSYWENNDILYKDGQSLEDIQTYYNNNNYTCS